MKQKRPLISKVFFVACALAATLLASCLRSRTDVVGKYEYSYPFGQVEVLTVEADGRLGQCFYKNWFQRKEGTPYLVHWGTWKRTGDGLDFENVYVVADVYHKVPRKAPVIMTAISGLYLDEEQGKPVIRFFDEGDGFYSKIETP